MRNGNGSSTYKNKLFEPAKSGGGAVQDSSERVIDGMPVFIYLLLNVISRISAVRF